MKPKSSGVSLKEIAEETNLSITTVSRVLRKRGEISNETREKVLEAAKRLRYRPNLLVHGIRTGRTYTVGVIVPPYDSYWTQTLYGIHDELSDSGYVYINTWCPHSNNNYGKSLLEQLHQLIDRRVDGIILWAHLAPLYNETVVEELEARDLPVVTIDHELPFADSVETDEKRGGALVAKHLIKLGHRHVAYLGWDESYKWAQLRRLYFEQKFTKTGGTCITKSAKDDSKIGGLALELIKGKPKPTAIYTCTDRAARIIYDTIEKEGLRIPKDIAVVGFADLDFAKWMQPPLTTVRQDGYATGKAAARLLIDRSQGNLSGLRPHRIRIGCKLIERISTAHKV